MLSASAWLRAAGLPERDEVGEESPHRFLDGGAFRIEIPSVEGPRVLEAVLEEARRLDCPVHRVSQGSGIQLMTDAELSEMARIGAQAGIEVSLFVGPRAGFDTGAMHLAQNGGVVRPRLRGADQLRAALDDIIRAYESGIRSVLVADEGLIALAHQLAGQGLWPKDLKTKASVMLASANPSSIRLWADFGIGTYNVPTDLSLAALATIRRVTPVPFDLYVEAPDDVGGFVRYPEIEGFIRHLAPVYLKFGVRNAPGLYPSGYHLEAQACLLGRERVRRARIAWERIGRLGLTGRMSPLPVTSGDLAVPAPQ